MPSSKNLFLKICKDCPKHQEEEDKALKNNASAFDACIDVWAFEEKCCKTCEQFQKNLKSV